MSGSGWRPIDPLDRAVETALERDLATLDAVHPSWQEHRTEFGRLEYTYPLRRTYRKHAIETGIIKGLYDLDRPTTEVMVIKGITRGADTADEEVPPGVLQDAESPLALRSVRRELEESTLDQFTDIAMEDQWLLDEAADPEQLDLIDQAMERRTDAGMRADRFHDHIWHCLQEACSDIDREFAEAGQQARLWTDRPTFLDRRDRWWRRDIVRTARAAEHYACFKPNTWWSLLGMSVNGADLRFVTSIHHVASAYTGVMAITSFGRIRIRGEEFSGRDGIFVETSWEPFTFSHHENVDDRIEELGDWLDQSLAMALWKFMHLTPRG